MKHYRSLDEFSVSRRDDAARAKGEVAWIVDAASFCSGCMGSLESGGSNRAALRLPRVYCTADEHPPPLQQSHRLNLSSVCCRLHLNGGQTLGDGKCRRA